MSLSTKWHIWFAWHPVRIAASGEWVWLHRVYRRQHLEYGEYAWSEYAKEQR